MSLSLKLFYLFFFLGQMKSERRFAATMQVMLPNILCLSSSLPAVLRLAQEEAEKYAVSRVFMFLGSTYIPMPLA